MAHVGKTYLSKNRNGRAKIPGLGWNATLARRAAAPYKPFEIASRRRRLRDALMTKLKINAGPYLFEARLETELAPATCESFLARLPFESHVVHVRWSGEGVWIPLGDYKFDVAYENHTSFPAPGQVILYPGGISETEILLAYGGVRFASKVGQLAGNHFLTLTSGLENLYPLGRKTLWEGAQKIRFELA